MPLFGEHESIGGGVHRSLYRAEKKGFDVIQIFTRHRLKWSARELSPDEIARFKKAGQETGVMPVSIHGSYLLNPASPLKSARLKTVDLLVNEVRWASELDIPFLVIHPGSHMGEGEERGMGYVSESLKEVFKRTSHLKVDILLETTAGQGTSLGYRFSHLKTIMDNSDFSDRIGICFDTCHVFAAGYDFSVKEGYRQTIENFDNVIGLDKLKIFHVNDSKTRSGSRVDRHIHPGQGFIGPDGLAYFLRDKKFAGHPFILETSKEKDPDGIEMDIKNLEFLKRLSGMEMTDDSI